jgi:beta-aspartyl-dipeptidase (metallo-type)
MLLLIKNARVYAPEPLGVQDILIANGTIVQMDTHLEVSIKDLPIIDAEGKRVSPGLIDQHIHIAGAGGKDGFSSLTPEVQAADLVRCGSTTTVGLLGTDATIKSLPMLYGKVQALRSSGLSTYMYSGYYGSDTVTITGSIQGDMVYVEPVLGFKIAIADIRSSYPTAMELVRKLREVRTGGLLSQKKGIMHVHLGALKSGMDVLFELVESYHFPIKHISPTHVGRTKDLFEQAIRFAKLGGMIDITTAASKYTDPYKSVIYAIDQGVPIDRLTFSTDGHAGLSAFDSEGAVIGFTKAAIDRNLAEIQHLVRLGGLPMEVALKLNTTNPADNLGLKNKGRIAPGFDADFCFFDEQLQLTDVIAMGKPMMRDGEVLLKPDFV